MCDAKAFKLVSQFAIPVRARISVSIDIHLDGRSVAGLKYRLNS